MLIRLPFVLLVCLCFFYFGASQSLKNVPQDYFINPLDINLRLSGSFGELRSNHFHSGVDLKTNQVTGLPVYAAANGYVGRVKIQTYGYGKALYITHPNGYVSVYAHLSKFSPRIEEYVKKMQYQKETYEIELFPTDLELRLDQGEVVAYSGNTGGSGGPHLHFEIRDSSERIINPLLFGMEIADSKRPLIKQMMAYPLDDNSSVNGKRAPFQLRVIPQKNGSFKVEPFKAYGTIGIGVNTSDQMDYENNQNGIYSLSTHFNGSKNFEMIFDRFSFDETRHLNQLIDYKFFKEHKSRISRLYVPDGSTLSIYRNTVNSGKLVVTDVGLTHTYKIEICDFKNNASIITLDIINDDVPVEKGAEDNSGLTYVNHNISLNETYGKFSLSIPSGALYENALLDIKEDGDTFIVHKDEIPVHKNMYISYDMSSKTGDNMNQYYIAERQTWGALYHLDSKLKGTILRAGIRNFGTYTIAKDDLAPTVVPLNFKDQSWISKATNLRMQIDDRQSGISGYRATLNGNFILMEYEYKDKILTHDLSDKIVTDGENHLKVIVTDNVGNSTTFEAILNFKS